MIEHILSPYDIKPITPELLDMVKELTGAKSVFIAISSEDGNHQCGKDECDGHEVNMNGTGFSGDQLLGLVNIIAKSAGYKLTEDDDFIEE